jgi:hypothetical protein
MASKPGQLFYLAFMTEILVDTGDVETEEIEVTRQLTVRLAT